MYICLRVFKRFENKKLCSRIFLKIYCIFSLKNKNSYNKRRINQLEKNVYYVFILDSNTQTIQNALNNPNKLSIGIIQFLIFKDIGKSDSIEKMREKI